MDLTKVLEQLRSELNNLNAAIASLQRLDEADRYARDRRNGYKRPAGRPPIALEKRYRILEEAEPEALKMEHRRPRCLENLQTMRLAMPPTVDVGPNEA